MTTVNFYQPGSVNATVEIPSTWNELTRAELLVICGDMMRLEEKGYEAKVNMLINIIALRAAEQKIKLPKHWKQDIAIDDVSTAGLDAVNFLFDSMKLTNQLIPEIKSYHGPAKDFDDLLCGEFEDAQFFFSAYKESSQLKDLAMLSAILWRPLENKKRISYKNYDVEKNLPDFMKLPAELLLANFFWFAGCMFQLPELFPKSFESEGGEPDPSAFTKCIHAGAGPKNGTREQIRNTLLKEFFFEIEQETIKAIKLDAQTT